MTLQSQPTPTAAALVAELKRSISDDDQASGRRVCTRLLTQLKRGVLPKLSQEESLALLTAGCGDGSDENESAALIPTLLAIINNDDDFSTEGHRETSVDVLKGLLRSAFQTDALQEHGKYDETLIKLLQQCSHTFQKRMARFQSSNNKDIFFQHGTMTEPMESSEHIRLLLVELMVDLGGYCLISFQRNDSTALDDETDSKLIIEATSRVCHTLAKSTFLDPYPELQRSACNLVTILAKLCPLAVRMNATALLVPLTGKVDDSFGNVEQASSTSMSKKSLFRHRHSKTRCKAVDASAAIVLCCLRETSGSDFGNDFSDNSNQSDEQLPVADHVSSYGSKSTSMERILQDTILPGWDNLLKTDPSASVQIAVLKSLGNVARELDWKYSPPSASNETHQSANSPNMDVASMVEAKVLTMFLTGISFGNVTQVRSMAVQQLNCLHRGDWAVSENGNKEQSLPREMLVANFRPMLDLILDSCSQNWAPVQSKVRSLESLQVILSIAIPLMDEDKSSSCSGAIELTNGMIRSIIDVLSTNSLDEEKEVLEAALDGCRILGSNNSSELIVSEITSMQTCKDGDNRSIVATDDDAGESNATISSPRQTTSLLLILDGMMKGYLCNKGATSLLHEMDPTLAIPTPNWFYTSPFSTMAISSLICHPTVTGNVATSSSLAWALLDACNSFVQCAQHTNNLASDKEWEVTENVMVNILTSIAYLLGCPEAYGLSSHAMHVLDTFSSSEFSDTCGSNGTNVNSNGAISLMDVHFRRVLTKIVSSAPAFPWKQSDPSFLAMGALLRVCSGSAVGGNFDLVAPFFISHLSTSAFSQNGQESDGAHNKSLKEMATTKDEMAEEYSLRISLMALLQTILSDESFSQTLGPRQREFSSATSTFTAQFTTDVLLSLVLPNLVWKAGGMASALRKLAAATLFSLLSHYDNKIEENEENGCALLHPETISHLIPILHSNLEDTDSTTREISCVCLSLVLKQVSTDTFTMIWETNSRVIDNMYPRLLELLDDSHDPSRMAACNTLGAFLTVAHAAASISSFSLGLSSLDSITSSLLIQLDDPNSDIQDHVFQLLLVLLELQLHGNTSKSCEKSKGVVDMMEMHINMSLKSHRDGSYCRLLLEKLQEHHE